jgi:hypothetical protein
MIESFDYSERPGHQFGRIDGIAPSNDEEQYDAKSQEERVVTE